jgi:hypothetical protein
MLRHFAVAMLLSFTLCGIGSQVSAQTLLGGPYPPAMFPQMGSWGVNIHNPYRAEPMHDLKTQWVRLSIRWRAVEVERKGNYDWQKSDKLINFYLENHFRPLVVLTVENINPLYKQDQEDKTLVINAIARWMQAAAERYAAKPIIWELGNEPEVFPMNGYWSNAKTYAKMAMKAASLMKRADPNCTIAALSLAWMDRSFATQALDEGLLDDGNIELLSFHGYHRRNLLPESGLAEDITWLRQMAQKYAPKGKVVDVIDSECGYSITELGKPKHWASWRLKLYSLEEQAAYLARHYLEEIACGIEVSIWYKDMNGEHAYSLYYKDEKDTRGLRPMGHVFRNLATLLPDNPKHMVNTQYPVSLIDLPDKVSAPDAFVNVRSYLRTYLRDQGQQQQLIVAMWNPVEAFDGKILESRKRQGDVYVETWRDQQPDDYVNLPVKVQVTGLKDRRLVAAQSCDILSQDSNQMLGELKTDWATGNTQFITDTLHVGPIPTVLVFDFVP